jgi:exodeoxyribonuclease III
MKLFSWNVNSLRNAEARFLEFLDNHQPDMVMIQELRAFPDQLNFFLRQIPGYEALFNPCTRPGYSGTALYYKTDLALKEVTPLTGIQILDDEGRTIISKFNNTYIINFYTPNGSSREERLQYKLQFYQQAKIYIAGLLQQGNSVILGGDLNVAPTEIDLYSPAQNKNRSGFLPAERNWFADLEKLGMSDTFRMFEKGPGFYSWWHLRDPKREQNRGWRFDYFLVSDDIKEKVKSATILKDVYGSDHCPIGLEIEL